MAARRLQGSERPSAAARRAGGRRAALIDPDGRGIALCMRAEPSVHASHRAAQRSRVRWGRGLATLLGPLLVLGGAEWAGLTVCPLKNAIGVPCPGCGLTRATLAALRGDFAAATRYHPLVWVVTPLVLLLWGQLAWTESGQPTPRWLRRLASPPRAVAWLLVAALLGVWVARFFGMFGGPVDPVDPSRGLFTRWLAWRP